MPPAKNLLPRPEFVFADGSGCRGSSKWLENALFN
jgi:hypothetical protein